MENKKQDKTIIIEESKLKKIKHVYYIMGYIFGAVSTMFLLSDSVMLFAGWGVGFRFND